MSTMIALVGQQQIPNLLPAFFKKPRKMLLVYSHFTEPDFLRLRGVLEERGICSSGLKCKNEYETFATTKQLEEELTSQGFQNDVIFNLTGGTKAMVLAAYECARKRKGQVVYLESGRGVSSLYEYHFAESGELALSGQYEISPLLSIEQFLDAHLGKGLWQETGYSRDIGGKFEEAVGETLRDVVDMKAGVRFLGDEGGKRPQADLDLVARIGNQFAVVEIKDQKKATLDALKQLHYLSRLLGTYTKKFWILSRESSPDHEAVIQATRTTVISIPEFAVTGTIDDNDKQKLRAQFTAAFN